MSAETQGAALGAPSNSVATGATLIATFYSPRGAEQTHALHLHLYRALAQAPEALAAPDDYHSSAHEVFVRRFDPPAAHDTTIIQLALNAPGSAGHAWETMHQRLKNLLEATVLHSIWGHTLIYQAVLAPGVDADHALSELLPSVLPLRSSARLQPLAHADVSGGRVWLLEIPLQGEEGAAATVYAALSPPSQEQRLVKDVLYGPRAALLMPDLIAHKGYHQQRQHRREELDDQYERSVDSLRKSVKCLLAKLRRQVVAIDGLDTLARDYSGMLPIISTLHSLHMSLKRQVHNYEWWRGRLKENDILEFHHAHLETAVLELELMVIEGRDVLEAASTALELARVQVEHVQERRQQQISILLAVLAVAFAVPQLIDRTAAGELLRLCGVSAPSSGNYDFLLLLGMQVGLIVGVSLLAIGAVLALQWLPARWRHG